MEMYANVDFYVVSHTWRVKPSQTFFFLVENKDFDKICETWCSTICAFRH